MYWNIFLFKFIELPQSKVVHVVDISPSPSDVKDNRILPPINDGSSMPSIANGNWFKDSQVLDGADGIADLVPMSSGYITGNLCTEPVRFAPVPAHKAEPLCPMDSSVMSLYHLDVVDDKRVIDDLSSAAVTADVTRYHSKAPMNKRSKATDDNIVEIAADGYAPGLFVCMQPKEEKQQLPASQINRSRFLLPTIGDGSLDSCVGDRRNLPVAHDVSRVMVVVCEEAHDETPAASEKIQRVMPAISSNDDACVPAASSGPELANSMYDDDCLSSKLDRVTDDKAYDGDGYAKMTNCREQLPSLLYTTDVNSWMEPMLAVFMPV